VKKTALAAAAREQLRAALHSTSGRASRSISGGHDQRLRTTVIALTAGSSLAEHNGPEEATLQVIVGEVVLESPNVSWQLRSGDFLALPHDAHSLRAITDAAILLTVSNGGR
jgi:quercetin dioxygenase-like cupin family protein